MPTNTNTLCTEPSICIPRTLHDANTDWRNVKDVFESILGKGTVDRVDVVKRRDDDTPFCRMFIHLRYWPTDKPEVVAWRKRLMDGDSIKVVHSNPWFWKCVASRLPRPESRNIPSKPYVMDDDAVSASKPNSLALENFPDLSLGDDQEAQADATSSKKDTSRKAKPNS